MTTEAGLVVVDKPAGMTSHDVVARVRRLAGTRKVGHAGTLDPMATGVLVLGINRATRLLGHLMLTEKAYDATIRLGATTTTDDAEDVLLGLHLEMRAHFFVHFAVEFPLPKKTAESTEIAHVIRGATAASSSPRQSRNRSGTESDGPPIGAKMHK